MRTAVIDAKREPGARVHTSGILVREAIDEIDIPHHLTRRVPGVRLYSPSLKSVDLFSPGYAFFTTRTADAAALDGAGGARRRRASSSPRPASRAPARERDRFRLDGIDIADALPVGADGARSRVAEAFGLSANRAFLTGARGRT